MRAGAFTAFFVGLALLVAGALRWGPERVERDLETRSREAVALAAPGATRVTIAATGRVLAVTGVVADDAQRTAVVAAVRRVRGASRVDDSLELARPAVSVPPTSVAPGGGGAPLGLGSLRAHVGGGKVRLQGSIPSQEVRVALVQRLLKKFGPLLADELQLGGDAAPELVAPFGRLVERGALSLSDGSFVLSDRTLVLTGTLAPDASAGGLVDLARRTSSAWVVVNALSETAPPTTSPPSVPPSSVPASAPPGTDAAGGATPTTAAPPPVDWQGRVDDLLTSAPVPLDAGAQRLPAVAGLVLEQVAKLVVAAEPAAVEVVVRQPAPAPVVPPSDPKEAAAVAAVDAKAAATARTRTQRQAALVVQALRDRGLSDVPMTATGAGAVAPPPGSPDLAVRVVLRYPPPPTTVPDTTVVTRSRRGSSSSGSSSRTSSRSSSRSTSRTRSSSG